MESVFSTPHSAALTRGARMLGLCLPMLLGACGGGGGGGGDGGTPPVAATLNLADDAAALNWNGQATIDILANDSVSRGVLTLESVSAPAHGHAAIVGGKLVYTPSTGYFGTDAVGYVARAAEGGATASATVSLTVSAQLQLQGSASGASLAGATVTAHVGANSFATTSDAQGAYSLNISSADPNDVVTLAATGRDAQAAVRLAAALGDMATLARQADSGGKIESTRAPALNLSHLSTASFAMVMEANGGEAPATQALLDTLSSILSPQRIVDLATAIELVADHGVALPAGAADTLALVMNPSSSQLLEDFLDAQTGGANAMRFTSVQADVLAGNSPSGAPPLAVSGPQSLAYFTGNGQSGIDVLYVVYRPDGSATVVRRMGAGEATWTVSAGAMTLTMQQPYSYPELVFNPISGTLDSTRVDITGYRLEQVVGSSSVGDVLVHEFGTRTMLDGSAAGQVEPFATAGRLCRSVDLAKVTALQTSEFTAGSQWGGVISGAFNLDPPFNLGNAPAADILGIAEGSSATLIRSARAVNWTVNDGWLRLTDGSTDRRYARLSRDAVTGEEHWLAVDFDAGVMTRAVEMLTVKVEPGLVFATAASSHRRWQSPFGTLTNRLYHDAYSDGTGALLDGAGEVLIPNTWTVDAEGRLAYSMGTLLGQARIREWTLLRRSASKLIVLERYWESGSFDFRRLAVYVDRGPSSR
ncbi:Ig-like domain-containing protein [Piscinibacter sp.]|uniref:Ig-like domain-containing protein n=1 Tax=Piscinibacter sp. TaxID=1903157 RepID=UPI0039E378BF